jgi:dUTP pyrophosphatase
MTLTPVIRFKRNLPTAVTPHKGTPGAAAFDLHAARVTREGKNIVVDTGLSTEFSSDYVLLVFSRSGMSRKNGIRLVNSVGVIDSDYRGPIQILLTADDPDAAMAILTPGIRCAQAILMPAVNAQWMEMAELSDSARGEGGFGSTGIDKVTA